MDPIMVKDHTIHETADKKLFRLKNKWLAESNLWMLAIIIIEWV